MEANRTYSDTLPSLRLWCWTIAIPLILFVLVGIACLFIDEPLRTYAERQLNAHIKGYTFHIGALDFHPMGLSLDLERVTVIQNDHPDPPVAELSKGHASIHWREVLSGHLVSDQYIHRPIVHFTRPQAAQEVGESSIDGNEWQEALFAIYPLRINEFHISNGDITYRENATSKPLHLSQVNFEAGNIRNIRSKPNQYHSEVHLDAAVFDRGRLKLEGQADFLAEPIMAINADINLQDISLLDLLPLTAQHQVHVSQGVLSAAGHLHYAPTVQIGRLKTLVMSDVKLDFVHAIRTQKREQQTGKKVVQAAGHAANHPTLILRIDQGVIEKSEFGFVNQRPILPIGCL